MLAAVLLLPSVLCLKPLPVLSFLPLLLPRVPLLLPTR
jgi:hypothetical protein